MYCLHLQGKPSNQAGNTVCFAIVAAGTATETAAADMHSRFSDHKVVKGKLGSVICRLTRGKLPTSGNTFISNEAKPLLFCAVNLVK
jgi:hypothetical protein